MKETNLNELWKKTLAQIEVRLDSPAHYKTWFVPTKLIEIQGKRAIIGVKNSYASDWLKKKHHDVIKGILCHVAKDDLEPTYVVSKDLGNLETPKITKKEKEQSSILTVKSGTSMDFAKLVEQANLNPKYNFKDLIIGPYNRLAHAASLAIVENPGVTYNPLFIYGGTGLGKTHVAQAIAHKLLEKSQGKKIHYTPSENFLNDMVASIKTGKTKDFRNKHRFLDLLIIDDIQLISKWEQTQDELFNTFNALHNKNKQIILISDRPPEEISNLEARLLSRFQGGMLVQVENPDFETRLAITEHKAKVAGISLPQEVLSFLAETIKDNIRVLEGSLQQIALFNQIHTHQISVEEVASLLGKDTKSKREKVKPQQIIKLVAREFSVTTKDVLSRSRKADIAFARQVAMFLLREDFKYKLEEVANFLNRKDHTTVIHAVDKIKSKLELEKGFVEQLQEIRRGY